MENTFELGSFENPIKCKDIDGEHKYFDALCGPDGKRIFYKRRGSLLGNSDHILDLYEVRYDGLDDPILVHMDMYAKPPYDKKPVKGLYLIKSFFKPKAWQAPNYLSTVLEKAYPDGRPAISDSFINMYFKAAYLLALGEFIYSKNDAFGCPQQEWDIIGIIAAANKMVHQVKGLCKENPLEIGSFETAVAFMRTFHYEPDNYVNPETIPAFSLKSKHIVTANELEIFFIIKDI
jgi:hypothetical protein